MPAIYLGDYGHTFHPDSICPGFDSDTVLFACADGLKLVDLNNGFIRQTFWPETPLETCAHSHSANKVVVGDLQGRIGIAELKGSQDIDWLPVFETGDGVDRMSIDPSGKFVAVSSQADSLAVVRLQTHEIVFRGQNYGTVAFSPDGKWLACGRCGVDEVEVVSVATMRVERRIDSGRVEVVIPPTFTADGQFLVTGGKDRTIKFWDIKTWQLKRLLSGHVHPVMSFAHLSRRSYTRLDRRSNVCQIMACAERP